MIVTRWRKHISDTATAYSAFYHESYHQYVIAVWEVLPYTRQTVVETSKESHPNSCKPSDQRLMQARFYRLKDCSVVNL